MKKLSKIILTAALTLGTLVSGLTVATQTSQAKSKAQTITVGIMSGTKDDDEFWNVVKKNAKDRYNLNVKYKHFTDYNTPNRALQSGDLDANAFQNTAFLNAWNKSHHTNIVSVGKTMLAPMKVYSKKYHSLKHLPNKATISIPNDTANEGRSLQILKNAGLITFKKGANQAKLTPNDIQKNSKHLQFKEVGAEQVAHNITSVDAGVVNTNYAKSAGLTTKEAIYTEPINKDSEKYASVIATTKKKQNNQAVKNFVKAYQSKNVKQELKKIYGNTKIAAWDLNFNK